MRYTIIYKESDNMYHMNGQPKMFVGQHLETIAKNSGIDMGTPISESNMVAILSEYNVQVDMLEEDGSPLDY